MGESEKTGGRAPDKFAPLVEHGGREAALARFGGGQRPVLDFGFVELLDLMGDDLAIEEAARVSYAKGTRAVSDRRNLIRYMMRHRHTSPFEMVEIKLRVKLPIFVERQWVRTRTANMNEVSARYSELPAEVYIPEPEQVCHQSKTNRQGRGEPVGREAAQAFRTALLTGAGFSFDAYRTALQADVARETARVGLPLGTYTEKIWKIDGHNLLRFLQSRLDMHAQWEIRRYAEAIAEIVRVWLPLTWEAFVDYRLQAVTLSRIEHRILAELAYVGADRLRVAAIAAGLSRREVEEFVAAFASPEGAIAKALVPPKGGS